MFFIFRNIKFLISILLLFSFSIASAEVAYEVKYEGIRSKDTLALLKSISSLSLLKDRPPSTLAGLRRRAEADVPLLLEGLHSLAYYDAQIDFIIDYEKTPYEVILQITPGDVYTFAELQILSSDYPEDLEEEAPSPLCEEASAILPQDLGVLYGKPALPKIILEAEKTYLNLLSKKGYPMTKIPSRKVLADFDTKTVTVIFYVNTGPLCTFGPTSIVGNTEVANLFIRRKICWEKGELYDPTLIDQTQKTIENSGLFNSVSIDPAEELNEEGELPINIILSESYHRTIGLGASYNTQFGLGFTAEWEHRNIRGLGEKISLRTDLWETRQHGTLLYCLPDFVCRDQDLLWVGELEREVTKGFTESFGSLSCLVNRKLTENTEISFGITFKQLDSENSDNNGSFTLVKLPAQWKWSVANNLLDPTRGQTFSLRLIPTFKIDRPQMTYMIFNLLATHYQALDSQRKYVFATKLNWGSIFGSSDYNIPPPERFYAGSENTLRGYSYLTVSPLEDHKPMGGRSLLIFSAEMRARFGEKWGSVIFYDIGNVQGSILPELWRKQLQSLGLGLRYHTPVGPLRMDIAFPLNRRPQLDNTFQLYVSIGQAF